MAHVDDFVEFAIEVGSNDVDLVNLPVVGSGECKESSIGFKVHDGSVGFEEILSRYLGATLGDESSLVLEDVTVGVSFDGKDPTASDRLATGRRFFKGVGAELEELSEFDVHSFLPFEPVGTGLDFFQRQRIVGEFGEKGGEIRDVILS